MELGRIIETFDGENHQADEEWKNKMKKRILGYLRFGGILINLTKCEFLSSSFIGELYEKKLCKGGLMNDLVTKFIEKSADEFLAPYFKVYLLQFLN